MDKELLSHSSNVLNERTVTESQLLEIQKKYFRFTQHNLVFGLHCDMDLVQEIKKYAFETIGSFQLINKKEFGDEVKYYIPQNSSDNEFEKLEQLYIDLKQIRHTDFEKNKLKKIEIENQIKKMSERILQIRIRINDIKPIPDKDSCFGIYKLSNSYSSVLGIELSITNQIL